MSRWLSVLACLHCARGQRGVFSSSGDSIPLNEHPNLLLLNSPHFLITTTWNRNILLYGILPQAYLLYNKKLCTNTFLFLSVLIIFFSKEKSPSRRSFGQVINNPSKLKVNSYFTTCTVNMFSEAFQPRLACCFGLMVSNCCSITALVSCVQTLVFTKTALKPHKDTKLLIISLEWHTIILVIVPHLLKGRAGQ